MLHHSKQPGGQGPAADTPPERPNPRAYAVVALVVSLVVLAFKAGAWLWTDSTVLMADAAESGLDLITALLLVLAVSYSSRPPDAGHPWGHGKIEYFSSGFQGALILAAGVGVIVQTGLRLLEPPPALELGPGLVLSIAATAVNLGLSVVLIRAGRRTRSPALVADGRHNAADVLTTLGGWTGLGLAWATGWWILDPLVALAVSVHILWTGFKIGRKAVAGLMDASLPPQAMAVLLGSLERQLEHDSRLSLGRVRARQSSGAAFVDCVLYVPGDMSVQDAHSLCDRLEESAAQALPGAQVHVHVEPAKDRPSP